MMPGGPAAPEGNFFRGCLLASLLAIALWGLLIAIVKSLLP